jgi:O-antigen ligase
MRKIRSLIYISVFLLWAESFPPTSGLFSFISIYGHELYWTDIVFGMLLLWSVANLTIVERHLRYNDLHQRTIFLFMLWGLIPFIYGWLNGNNNLFSTMRLFVWGLLAIIGPLSFLSFQQFYNFIKFHLFLHTIAIFYYFIFILTGQILLGTRFLGFNQWDITACIILISAIAVFSKDKKRYEKFLISLVLPLSIFIVIIDQSRTLYIVFLISIFIFTFTGKKLPGFRLQNFRNYFLLSSVIFLLLILPISSEIFSIVQGRFESLVKYETDKSAMVRIIAWNITLEKIIQHPILGSGSGAEVGVIDILQGGTMTPHNVYLQTAVWGGISTVLFFLIVQVKIIRHGLKESLRASPRISVFLLAGSTIMIAILFASIFSPAAGNIYFSYWFYATLVLIPLRLEKKSALTDQKKI